MLSNKKAVIFDLDGTLVDSIWIWSVVDERFLAPYGIAVPEDLSAALEGFSFEETAYYFKDRFQLPLTVEQIKAKWNQMAKEIYVNEVKLKPGVKEFLEYLKQERIPVGIATSNSRQLALASLESHHIDSYIQYLCSSNEVTKGKPNPDVYLKAAEELGVEPEKTLIFEDIPYGIMAGKRANMTACAVYDPYSQDVIEEKKKLADYYIDTYFDVLNGTFETL